jgi:hypothetical protein
MNTMQWPIEKGQNDKQISTKLYIEKYRLSYTNSTKTGSELRCSGRVSSSYSNNKRFSTIFHNLN